MRRKLSIFWGVVWLAMAGGLRAEDFGSSFLQHYLFIEFEDYQKDFCRLYFSVFDFPDPVYLSQNRCFVIEIKDRGCSHTQMAISFDSRAEFQTFRDAKGSSFWNLWKRNEVYLTSVDYVLDDLRRFLGKEKGVQGVVAGPATVQVLVRRLATFFIKEWMEQNSNFSDVQSPVADMKRVQDYWMFRRIAYSPLRQQELRKPKEPDECAMGQAESYVSFFR